MIVKPCHEWDVFHAEVTTESVICAAKFEDSPHSHSYNQGTQLGLQNDETLAIEL